MSVIDPVADMLTRVRNACLAGHRRVDMPESKLKVAIATILRDNHYVQDFKVLADGQHGMLRLYLKYHNDAPVIRELHRVSSPELSCYRKAARDLRRTRASDNTPCDTASNARSPQSPASKHAA